MKAFSRAGFSQMHHAIIADGYGAIEGLLALNDIVGLVVNSLTIIRNSQIISEVIIHDWQMAKSSI